MNVTIVGGSAQSTPALFDTAFALPSPHFRFTLAGRCGRRLAAVARASKLVAANRGYAAECSITTVARDYADADVVLVQFRIGGYEARAGDETFPHRYGLCGDEGLGPGGLASAWRTWPELALTLAAVALANPRATVLLLTSPVGILTRCARDAFPALRIYGICELPWTTLHELCAAASGSAAGATFAYVAVNHLGWFSNVRSGAREIVGSHAVHPLKYVRLGADAAAVLAEQRAANPRAIELAALAADAYTVYGDGAPADVVATVRRRKTPWYAHAVAPFLRSLAGDDTGVTYFLTARNHGYWTRLDADEIVEMPFVMRGGRLERIAAGKWQHDDIAQTLERLVAYERRAADAVRGRDTAGVDAALRLHPWLDGIAVGAQLVADIVGESAAALTSST